MAKIRKLLRYSPIKGHMQRKLNMVGTWSLYCIYPNGATSVTNLWCEYLPLAYAKAVQHKHEFCNPALM